MGGSHDHERALNTVLQRHEGNWKLFAMNMVEIPQSRPYASTAVAWGVTIKKEYNEMSDEQRCPGNMDEAQIRYYQSFLPREWTVTMTVYAMDVVIVRDDGDLFIVPAEKQQGADAGIGFLVTFPQGLPY